MTGNRWGFTTFQLKVLAILTMLIDHIGVIFFPGVAWIRCIGRLAFPIFCFLLVEGFYHTRSRADYLRRLGIFAILSEVPYDLAFHGSLWTIEGQNVFLTLFIGFAMLCLLEREQDMMPRGILVVLAMWAAEMLHTDYGARGILLIAIFRMTRDRKASGYFLGAGWNFLWQSRIQYAGALAMIPIGLYNGEKGKSMKYFFYLFYPVHLLILYLAEAYLPG